MSTESSPRYVRLQVELVVELTDEEALRNGAVEHIRADEYMPEEDREPALESVQEDASEAVAYFIDPFDLVSDIPGVELAQASWQSEIATFDPDSLLEDEEEGYEDEDEEEDGDDR
ncbi:hypothetical protein [Allostreptomyces psammosilenae]|uniref:Uncharacterized protein n=1 Tax=Allostreptomyces psammosilenae TaxID=1892865 RepID=A0A852ZWI7_9ACTN|nr:hypothetical protein [Allostreptomyces psammosilenae]NYI06047.1 hypothetical protein [Allostreptomyces psammosilenae]